MITEYATPAHVDPDVLTALQDVMEDQYPVLLDTFLSDSQSRLSHLRETCDRAIIDRQSISQAAHSFKGSSSNMGAVSLAALCSRLEQCANQPACDDIKQLVVQIDREFGSVKRVYERERERFPA